MSQRVHDAAEGLLSVIMDRVVSHETSLPACHSFGRSEFQGSFPPPCGPESLCSLLDEESLLNLIQDGDGVLSDEHLRFRYYVIDGTTIVALLEQALCNDESALH